MTSEGPTRSEHFLAWLACVLAVGLRVVLAVFWPAQLDGDECAEVLMAMDVRLHPRFLVGWLGQDYMGSPEFYLLAWLGPLGDWSPTTIRLVMGLLVTVQLGLLAVLAQQLAGPRAVVATMLGLCLLPPMAYPFELRARGYQLMLALVLAALVLAVRRHNSPSQPRGRALVEWLLLGLLAATAVWTNELALLLLLPVALVLLAGPRPTIPAMVAGATGLLLPLLPRLTYHLRTGFAGFGFLWLMSVHFSAPKAVFNLVRPAGHGASGPGQLRQHLTAVAQGVGVPLLLWFAVGLVQVCGRPWLARWRQAWRSDRARVALLAGLVASIGLVLAVSSQVRYAQQAVPFLALSSGLLAGIAGAPVRLRTHLVFGMLLAVCLCTVGAARLRPAAPAGAVPEAELARRLLDRGYRRGLAGYYPAHKLMYYSQRALAVSALGGPEFTTRFLGVEREVWDQGAQFIVFTLPVDRERVNGLRRFLAERGQACSTELVAGQFLVCHGFSQPVFPGQYLPATDRALFERHTPVHPAKIARDRANVLW